MKFIWLSVAPWAVTGYGTVTRAIVRNVDWNGCKVISGMDVGRLNRLAIREEVDFIITLLDIHTLGVFPRRWVAYSPIDVQTCPLSVKSRLDGVKYLISMSKHAKAAYSDAGHKSTYCPHGVDTDVYYVDDNHRKAARKRLNWESNFVVGTVGVNYTDQRKNFVNLLFAFKTLHDNYPETRLFMNTNMVDDGNAYPLPMITDSLGISEFVRFVDSDDYYSGNITDINMANAYRAMDVMCLPTKGEGFGLPLIEAQACGTPIITTNASTGPELTYGGWLIKLGKYDWEWFNKSWRSNASSQSIYESLKESYKAWKNGTIRDIGIQASEQISKEYNWDYVFDTYWKPILNDLNNFDIVPNNMPDYNKLYNIFDGRIMMGNCSTWCKLEKCPYYRFNLYGETEAERNIMSRSYPVIPDKNGKLFVDTRCPLHNWISKRFKQQVKESFDYLWGFPRVRDLFSKDLPSTYISIDDINYDFDDKYKWAMQSHYRTICPDLSEFIPKGSKVLDIGCGDGARIGELRDKGFDALGCEINKTWVGGFVDYGSAECLPYDDNSFDVVLSIDVLEHLENPIIALKEMFRVCKNRAFIIITPMEAGEFYEDPTHKVEWDISRWKREISEFGEIEGVFPPYGFLVMNLEEKNGARQIMKVLEN